MKAFFKNFRKSNDPSLTAANASASTTEPEPATLISTVINTADIMPPVPTGSATASAQVIQPTGVTVSLQPGLLH